MLENALSFASSFSGSPSQMLELLSAVASAVPDAMFVKDLAGKYLFCNAAGVRFLDQPLERILNHDDVSLLGHDVAQRTMAADQRVMSTGITETEEQIITAIDVVRVFQFTRTPYRDHHGTLLGVIGHAREVTPQYRAEETIRQIATGNSATGQAYFESIVAQLCQACRIKIAFIGVSDPSHPNTIRTLTVCKDGKLVGNFSYDLAHTPCENVVRNGFCFYPSGVQQSFPLDTMLVELGIESYMGIPLFSGAGKPLGLIVLVNDRRFPLPDQAKTILEVIAARAGAELERMQA
jgi:PAS domain S-box-containing protein